jgi:Flp pilus assembly protein TadD
MFYNFFSILSVFFLFSCAIPKAVPRDDLNKVMELVDKGVLELRNRNLEEAKSVFEYSLEIATIPENLEGIGCVYLLQGELALANFYFNKVRELFPDYVHIYGNLALLYELQGDLVSAKKEYEKALDSDVGFYQARSNYAVFLYQNKEFKEARDRAREAMIVTNDPLAKNIYMSLTKKE